MKNKDYDANLRRLLERQNIRLESIVRNDGAGSQVMITTLKEFTAEQIGELSGVPDSVMLGNSTLQEASRFDQLADIYFKSFCYSR